MRCAPTFSALYDSGVLALHGDLDLASHADLSDRLYEAGRLSGGTLRLDVGGVRFIDCGCLGLIDAARRCLQADGRRLDISGASPGFRRVSRLAGYDALTGPDASSQDA